MEHSNLSAASFLDFLSPAKKKAVFALRNEYGLPFLSHPLPIGLGPYELSGGAL